MRKNSNIKEGAIMRLVKRLNYRHDINDIGVIIKINENEIHCLIKNEMQCIHPDKFVSFAEIIKFNNKITQAAYPDSEILDIVAIFTNNWELAPFCLSFNIDEKVRTVLERGAEIVCICARLKSGELKFPKYLIKSLFI